MIVRWGSSHGRAVLDAVRRRPWLLRGIEITLFAVVIGLCAWAVTSGTLRG
jgi:hypothetical protein